MKKIALHLSRATWIALVFCLILLAIVISAARVVLPMVDGLRGQIVESLSSTLETRVYLGELTGRLHNFNPAISLDQIVIYQSENPEKSSVSLKDIILELDTIATLTNLEPVFRRVMVGGGEVSLTGEPGHVGLAGFPQSEEEPKAGKVSERKGVKNMLEVLSRQRQIDFENVRLSLAMASGKTNKILVEQLTLSGPADARKMSARIQSEKGEVVKLAMNVAGHAMNWPDVVINGYVSTPILNFKKWLSLLPGTIRKDAKLKFNHLRAGTEAWFSYSPEGWDVRGSLFADMVDVDREDQSIPPLTALDTEFSIKFGKGLDQQLWLNNLSFIFSGYSYPQSNVYIQKDKRKGGDILIAADQVYLRALSMITTGSNLLPKLVGGIVSRLAPHGRVNNLVVRLKPSAKPFDLDLSAELHDVGVDHWYGAPSGERINAKLRMSATQGVIDLDSRGFTLGLDNVFDDVWVYDRVDGKLYWNITNDVYVLRTDRLSFTGGEGDLEARLRLDIPFDGSKPLWMALEAGITSGDAIYTGKYLPSSLESLNSWLNSAVKGGDISQGAFIWNGPLTGPPIDNDLTWGLFFDLANADLAYDPEWPEVKGIDGLVTVDQDEILVKADKARIYNSRLTGVTALVPDLLSSKRLSLQLEGRLASNGKDGLRLLRETPIASALGNAADQWEIGGDLNVRLKLDIPLTKANRGKEDINVAIGLQNNRFAIPSLNIDASRLNGNLSYSTAKGLSGSGLTGSLFEQPVSFSLNTISGSAPETRIDVNGRITMSSLTQWLKQDFLWLADGETDYKARVSIGSQGAVRVDINSDLVGVASTLPAPLDKTKQHKLPHSITVRVGSKGPIKINGSLKSRFNYALELDRTGERLLRAGARLGNGKVEMPVPGSDLLITGKLDSLQLKPWNLWWQKNADKITSTSKDGAIESQKSSPVSPELPVEVKYLSIDRLLWGDTGFNQVQVSYTKTEEGMNLGLKAPEGEGSLVISSENRPLQVNLEQLNLPTSVLPDPAVDIPESSASVQKASKSVSDYLADINPSDIPDLDVQIKDIRIGTREFGSLNTKIRTVKNGIKTTQLEGVLGGGNLDGSFGWTKIDGRHHTVIKASVDSRNVEEFLSQWGYPELMTGKRLKTSSFWSWEGSPAGFKMTEMEGESNIEIKNGRFLSVSSKSSSALRLFGVLNVDAITRRLRLDFSDLYRSGMAFDQVEGKLAFNKGKISFAEPITIKGPSSDFRLDGSLDVTAEQLDMGLVVTLPVTQNIAVVSLLLGQPYIAGAAYLFDKLLGSTLEQFASLRYEIKGSFAEPEMKLDRLFSNKAKSDSKK